MPSKKQLRHRHLLSLLDKSPNARVNELAESLSVSTETVRRDLDELSSHGLVDRTYGGALLKSAQEPIVNIRHSLMVKEREAIAKKAVACLKGAKFLMVGSGATTTHVARRIAIEMNTITVLTHSFGVATVLSLNPTITILMAPGQYHATEGAMHGSQTLRYLNDFQVDWAITGASGITSAGASDALIDAGEVYSCMSRQASRAMIVADHTKFNKVFPARFAKWADVHTLVTDIKPTGKLLARLEQQKVSIALCDAPAIG
ncbi:MAG: DeoR/GlpR family DNA-binding transcription regulator [Granulosicoccus sp.]